MSGVCARLVYASAYPTAFIAAQVERGRHNAKSDVMRAGVRLLAEQEVKPMALRASLIEGERSGTSVGDIRAAVKTASWMKADQAMSTWKAPATR